MHTKDTVMPSLANLRVHIAPVGFEVDRIVIPVKQTRADKIWLLVHNNSSEDKSLPYQKKLEQQFKKLKIQVRLEESVFQSHILWDMHQTNLQMLQTNSFF